VLESLDSMSHPNYSEKKRLKVWARVNGNVRTYKCYVTWCNNYLDAYGSSWDMGHNIPYSELMNNNQVDNLDNLFPICRDCNLSMGNDFTIYEWSQKIYVKDEKINIPKILLTRKRIKTYLWNNKFGTDYFGKCDNCNKDKYYLDIYWNHKDSFLQTFDNAKESFIIDEIQALCGECYMNLSKIKYNLNIEFRNKGFKFHKYVSIDDILNKFKTFFISDDVKYDIHVNGKGILEMEDLLQVGERFNNLKNINIDPFVIAKDLATIIQDNYKEINVDLVNGLEMIIKELEDVVKFSLYSD